MTINFTEVAIPAVTRTSEPNPFTALAESRKANTGKAAQFHIELTGNADDDAKTIAKAKRHLSLAGKAADVTLRSIVETSGSGAKTKATFTVWAVARITKARKGDKAAVTDSPVK